MRMSIDSLNSGIRNRHNFLSMAIFYSIWTWFREYQNPIPREPRLSTHAKFKKSIFHPKILQFVGEIFIISNYFQSWFSLTIKVKIWVKSIWLENSKIHGIQPIHRWLKSLLKTLNWNNWILSSSDSGVIMDIYRLSKKQSILMRGNNESWVV